MKRLKILSLFFTFFWLFPSHANAQEREMTQMIRVSPVIFNISLSPGTVQTYTATVENLLSVPLPIDISLNDFAPTDEEGGVTYTESRTDPLLSWTRLSETQIILPAKSKRDITLTVTLPKRIPVGGYYGVLYFSPVLPNYNGQTQVAAKVGSLLLANIGVPDPNQQKAEILEYAFTRPFFEDKTAEFSLRVKNIALHHFTAKPVLVLKPLFGSETHYPIEEKFVFPGKVRRWDQTITYDHYGIYKAIINVSTGNGQKVISERYVILFPVTKAAFILVAAVALLFITVKRKQFKSALRILLRGK